MKKLILILCLIVLKFNAISQVTVGSDFSAETGSLLEVKQKEILSPIENDLKSLTNSEKGILFPKVSLKSFDKLTPLYGGIDDGKGNWSDDSTPEEKLKATGMVVFNTNEDAESLDRGLYMWQLDEWIKLSEANGAASFDIVNCDAIRINGSYTEGIPTTDSEYINIVVNAKKKGSYAILITSNNGYSFFKSGTIVELGTVTIKVPAQGTPVKIGIDKLNISGLNIDSECAPTVEVLEAISTYSLVCSSAIVQGDYYKNQPLTASNSIKVNINVSKIGSYNIYTENKNGISFSSKGTFSSIGTQSITLTGSGIPSVNDDFNMDLYANTVNGTSKCTITIPIILPEMTYAIIGYGVWSWAAPARTRALANSGNSFSPTGNVRIKNFSELWSTNNSATAERYLTSGYQGKYPDVVLYFAYGTSPTRSLTTALYNYINAGGCLLYGSSDNTANAVQILMDGLFGSGTVTVSNQTGGGLDNVYQIAYDTSNPIINGPFGNLSGQYWGEDNESNYSIIMENLPSNSVQICSAISTTKPNINPAYSIVWYNDRKNFIYFGDSTGASLTDTSTNSYPTVYNNSGVPISKLYGPGAPNNKYVYNAALELNSIAFLVKKAAVSGINNY